MFGISNYRNQTAEEDFLQALYPSRNGKKHMAQQNLLLKWIEKHVHAQKSNVEAEHGCLENDFPWGNTFSDSSCSASIICVVTSTND